MGGGSRSLLVLQLRVDAHAAFTNGSFASGADIASWPASHYVAYHYPHVKDDPAASRASVVYNAGNGNVEVYYNSGGRLTETYWTPDSGWKSPQTIGGSITGNPSAIYNAANHNIEVYSNSGGHLTETYWSSISGWQNPKTLSGTISGDPSAVYNAGNDNVEVYYNLGGKLAETYWSSVGDWQNAKIIGGEYHRRPFGDLQRRKPQHRGVLQLRMRFDEELLELHQRLAEPEDPQRDHQRGSVGGLQRR